MCAQPANAAFYIQVPGSVKWGESARFQADIGVSVKVVVSEVAVSAAAAAAAAAVAAFLL
jgi:hypothetical protein